MQRYFITDEAIKGKFIIITGDDFHHITRVMRMKIGDQFYCCNTKQTFICQITMITNDIVKAEIKEEIIEQKELKVRVSIAQGIISREKMEEVIDHITELGASLYLPVIMNRCTAKLNEEKLDKKIIRMNKIAKEASEQSHRANLLKVENPLTFANFLALKSQYDLCLYAYEIIENTNSLKQILANKNLKSLLILVGPEGGISKEEANLLNQNGFLPVNLGPRILRTEVAPSYIMSVISSELEG